MRSSLVRKLTSFVATVALVLMTSLIAGAYSQTGNELITWANMNTATSDGTFVLSASGYGSCSYGSSLQTLTGSTFSSCEYNNGGCSSATENYTFAQYQACALFNYVIDPFMINSGTSWPTASGSIAFAAYSYPGGSGSDKMAESLGTSGSGGIVYQALSHGQTIGSGHAISVTAYLYNQQVAFTNRICTTGSSTSSSTVYGTATPVVRIRLGSATGTIEATSSSPGVNAWTSETASYTTAAAGVYYATLELNLTSTAYYTAIPDPVHGTCSNGSPLTGYGNAYAGNVTTSG